MGSMMMQLFDRNGMYDAAWTSFVCAAANIYCSGIVVKDEDGAAGCILHMLNELLTFASAVNLNVGAWLGFWFWCVMCCWL